MSAGLWLWLWSPAYAQAPATDLAEEADLQFRRGTQAYLARQYEEALEHLLASNRLVPNQNVLFNIGMAYVQLRDYDAAYRHFAEYLAREERPDARARAEEVIVGFRNQVALVRVESDPPGANVYVDREDLGSRGRTPLLLAITPGEHRLILDLAGHLPAELTAVARKGQEQAVEARLEAIVGTLRIQGGPPGAEIRIGDEAGPVVGTLPTSLDLPAGKVLLVVSAPGHTTERRLVDVTARTVNEALVKLDVLKGRLVVEALSQGALIEIDGEAAGFTPTVLDVPVGSHAVRITAEGYRPYEAQVEIASDASTPLDVRLRPMAEVTAASRSPEAVEDAPASVSIISAEEIRAFAYQDVYDALGGTRGVFRTNDLTYKALGFRGFSRAEDYGNRVLSTLDGHVLNDDQVGASLVSSDLMTDLVDLSRIEVVRGPGSALYGSNAFFGVVNLVTHDHGSPPPPHLAATGDQGRTIRARIGAGAGDSTIGGWISVAGLQSGGEDYRFEELAGSKLAPTGRIEDLDGSRSGTAQGSAWVEDLTIQGFVNSRRKAYPTAAYGTRPGDPRALVEDTRGFVEARYAPELSQITHLDARAYLDYSQFHGQYPYTQVYTDDWAGLWAGVEPRLVAEPTAWFSVTVGAEVKRELAANMESFVYRSLADDDIADQYIEENPLFGTYSGYVLTELGGDLLRAHIGARYDFLDLPEGASDETLDALSPRLALVSHPTDRTAVKLVAGQAFRAPSPYEYLYSDGGYTQARPESLDPETVRTGEAEVTQRFSETASVIVAGYYNQIAGLVDTTLDSSSGPIQYTNVDDATRSVGAEIEVRREWRDGWMASVQHSVQHTRIGDLVEGDPIDNSPAHLFAMKLAVPVSDLVTGSTRVIVESPRIGARDTRTPWILLWDATVSGSVPGLPLRWVLGGRNLLDWKIAYPAGSGVAADAVPQPGRSIVIGLSASLPDRQP